LIDKIMSKFITPVIKWQKDLILNTKLIED